MSRLSAGCSVPLTVTEPCLLRSPLYIALLNFQVNTRQQVRRRLLRPPEAEEGRGTDSTSAETSEGTHGDHRTLDNGDRTTPGCAADAEAGPAGAGGTTGEAVASNSGSAASGHRLSSGGGKAGVMDTAREMWEVMSLVMVTSCMACLLLGLAMS